MKKLQLMLRYLQNFNRSWDTIMPTDSYLEPTHMLSLLILLCVSHFSNGLKISEDPVAESLAKLISKIFLDMPKCVVTILSDYTFHGFPDDILFIKAHSSSSSLFSILRASYRMNCTGYLVDENSAEYFLTTLGKARSSAVERHIPRIVFIPNQMGKYSQSVFQHPESLYIPDMVAIHILSDDQLERGFRMEVITNIFQGNLTSKEAKVIGFWPFENDIIFPDKLKNLSGKELIVAAVHYPPYVLLHPKFDGMEARIIHEFCRLHNCKINILDDDHLWGEIFENGTGVGVFGNVYMDRADIGIGGLSYYEYGYHYLDFICPGHNAKVHVLVPKPAQIAEWKIPLLPFSYTLWALQIMSIITAAVVMYTVNKISYHMSKELMLSGEFASGGGIFVRALAMSLLQPPPDRLPSGSPLRRFFTIFEFLFLFFTTIYSGALSSILTIPLYDPPIDSQWQLSEAGIPWAADHYVWIFSIQGATEEPLKTIVERFEVLPTETLITVSKKGGYGFAIELMSGGHLPEIKYLSGDMLLNYHVMRQELYTSSLLLALRKGSPYAEDLNRFIGQCIDHGLLLLWETDVALTYLSRELQTALEISEGLSNVDVHHPTKLRLIHIQGAFIFLAIGLIISLIVFLSEKIGSQNIYKFV